MLRSTEVKLDKEHLGESTTHFRACNLCEAICGLKIEVRSGQIISIKGDPDDPLSRGHICSKAVAMQDIQSDPDRLRRPMRRITSANGASQWQEISWDVALDTVAEQLVATRQQYGDDALAEERSCHGRSPRWRACVGAGADAPERLRHANAR